MSNAVDLIERLGDLAPIEEALSGAAAGKGSLAFISGPAGIGKTALLDAARESARSRGFAVLSATATELERGFPFGLARQLSAGPRRCGRAEIGECDRFALRPERFLEGKPAPYLFTPFGGGIRRCVGAPLANSEIRIVLKQLLRRFSLEPAGTPEEKMKLAGATLAPSRGGRVVLRRRDRGPSSGRAWSSRADHLVVSLELHQLLPLLGVEVDAVRLFRLCRSTMCYLAEFASEVSQSKKQVSRHRKESVYAERSQGNPAARR